MDDDAETIKQWLLSSPPLTLEDAVQSLTLVQRAFFNRSAAWLSGPLNERIRSMPKGADEDRSVLCSLINSTLAIFHLGVRSKKRPDAVGTITAVHERGRRAKFRLERAETREGLSSSDYWDELPTLEFGHRAVHPHDGRRTVRTTRGPEIG